MMAILLNELTREPPLPLEEADRLRLKVKKDVNVICSEVTSLHPTSYTSIITAANFLPSTSKNSNRYG